MHHADFALRCEIGPEMQVRAYLPNIAVPGTKAPVVILLNGSSPLRHDDVRLLNAFSKLCAVLAARGYCVLVLAGDDDADPMVNLVRISTAKDAAKLATKTLLTADGFGSHNPTVKLFFEQGDNLKFEDVQKEHANALTGAYTFARDMSKMGRSHPSWRCRALDGRRAVDAVVDGTLERMVPELAGVIDRDSICIAGHSKGSVGAMMMAGAEGVPPQVVYTNTHDIH